MGRSTRGFKGSSILQERVTRRPSPSTSKCDRSSLGPSPCLCASVVLLRRIAVCMLLLSSWVTASDEPELSRYFSELRLRGLFSIAEEYGAARLAEPDRSPVESAIVAAELSKVYAAHAAEQSGTAADELWARAAEVIESIASQSDNPRWIAVRVRQATLPCDRAISEFWQHRLDPDSQPQLQAAIERSRAALDAVAAVAADLQSYGKTATRGNRTPDAARAARQAQGAPSTAELRSMGDELQSLQIRMNLQLAQLLPIGPDRAAALLQAESESAALAKHVNSDFLWPARLARVETLRLSGDPQRAFTLAKSYLNPELPDELAEAVAAEQARALLAQNQPADAIALILDQGQQRGQLGPEARTVTIECLLQTWQSARDKQAAALADDLWRQMAAQQTLISGPWRSYVDALLARSSLTKQYGEKLARLVRDGRNAAQSQNWDQATTSYAQAVEQATQDGQLSLAAELAFTLASIQIQAGQFEQASILLRDYPTRFPMDGKVPEAHLLAAWTLGKLHEQQPTDARRADYLMELKRHLELYPDHPSAGEAQWSLAVDAIQHQEWATAVESLESIAIEHARAGDVSAQLPYVYEQVLAAQTEDLQRQAWEGRARAQLGRQVARWPKPPAGWSLAACEAAIHWTRTLMRYRERPYREIDQLLTQILHSREVELREVARDGSKIDPAWDRLVPAATQLRIVALAGQGQMGAAEQLLSGTDASPQELLAILSGLSQMADRLDERSQHDLGRVQLVAARRVHSQRDRLPAELIPVIDRCLAEAYVATGDLPEAIAIYETQLKSRPRDRALLETIGRLRIEHADSSDLQRAKAIYRQIEAFDPAGSTAWLRTRLTVARVCLKLGEKSECEKLLKVTRILYPELGGASLKAEYAALEQELKP